ncbi:MAG: hypothetical protein QM586_10780, partial [Xenophilus sp.]
LRLADRAVALRQSPHEAANNALCRARLAAMRGDGLAAGPHLDTAMEAFQRLAMDWHLRQAEALRATL